ncbi:MAG: Ig-like domain-containing protein [bacterium]
MKRIKVLKTCLYLCFIWSAFLIAGCGGGGHWTPPSISDTAAPTVTSVVPLNNAPAVAINTKIITAIFSETMDPATLMTSSFYLECPAGTPATGPVAVSYIAAGSVATLTLPPATDLPSNTTCTATITAAAKDLAGNPLAVNKVWTFNTGAAADNTAPTVTAVVPLNNAPDVAINTKIISAAFSEAMDITTLNNSSFTLACPTGTPVNGVVSYVTASNVAKITIPAAATLPSNTICTVTITTAAKDLAGNALASIYQWTFTTSAAVDNTAPRVTAVIPLDHATGVLTTTAITAVFSEAMDPDSINTTTFTVKKGSTAVSGAVTYSGLTAVFTPDSRLDDMTLYTATIAAGVMDIAGNALANE